jgi:hypothetical protein
MTSETGPRRVKSLGHRYHRYVSFDHWFTRYRLALWKGPALLLAAREGHRAYVGHVVWGPFAWHGSIAANVLDTSM